MPAKASIHASQRRHEMVANARSARCCPRTVVSPLRPLITPQRRGAGRRGWAGRLLVARLRINEVYRRGEGARAGGRAEASAFQQPLHETVRQIARGLVGEQVVEAEGAKVEVHSARLVGKDVRVLGLELLAPVEEHVVLPPTAGRRTRHQHEMLVEEMLHGEARRLPRPVHHRKIQGAFEQPLADDGRDRGASGDGEIGHCAAHPTYPLQ